MAKLLAALALIVIIICTVVLLAMLLGTPTDYEDIPNLGQDEWAAAWVEENPGTYSEWNDALYSACVDSTREASGADLLTAVPVCTCSAKALLDEFGVKGVERLVTGRGMPYEEELARELHGQCLVDPLP